jgi:hypothetical protein
MTEHEEKLADVLLDALMCHWEDNGNVCAGAVRDSCIEVLAEILDTSFDEIVAMIEERINNKQ